MISFTEEELKLLNDAVYKAWQRAAPKSKSLRTLTRLKSRLKEYIHTGSLFTEPCGCELSLKNGTVSMDRCMLHDAGIDSAKILTKIVDCAASANYMSSDDMQDILDEAENYINELKDVAGIQKG